MLTPTPDCFALIKKWEGLHKKRGDGQIESYLDPVNIWTIGYGSTFHRDLNRPIQPGDIISLQAAERWLSEEVGETAEDVNELCKVVPLTNGMFDALVSFSYNASSRSYIDFSQKIQTDSQFLDDANLITPCNFFIHIPKPLTSENIIFLTE